ncbi:MAG: 50S ribosomal protein L32 [Victivallales bacterium]|jgi:ribosomal protein L32
MGVPKRKMSKMKKRQRIAANSYEGVQANFCANCGEPAAPHTVCKHCGTYKGKQILTVEQ